MTDDDGRFGDGGDIRTRHPEAPDRTVLERLEEDVVADVTPVEVGRVRVEKRVAEEPRDIDVTLRHHEVDVERRPVDRPLQDGEETVAIHGEETVLLVVQERLEVRKVPWVVEEVLVRRRSATETRHIADTVRTERFDISTKGEVELDDRG